jgi:hypothetical protein
MSDQVADVLDDAADLLEREGWVQGHLQNQDGYCMEGALARVCPQTHTYGLFWDAMAVLSLHLYSVVDQWNDAPGRTKQQVLDELRFIAKRERMPPETPAPPGTPDPRGVGQELAGDAPMSG